MFSGDVDIAFDPSAGGGGHDPEPAFPPEELWTQLHPHDEDGPPGKRPEAHWKLQFIYFHLI